MVSNAYRPTLRIALERVGTAVAFGVAPVCAFALMLSVGLDPGPLSHDFHYELYPEAAALLDGRNPFPDDFDPANLQPNLIWPPVAALLVSPLTALPIATADVVMAFLGLVCFGLALWLVGLRDWRVYGAFALWPQAVGEMRVSHLTPVLALLLALAWRDRDRELRAGLTIGLAIALKFFLWPLAVWLASERRLRGTALAVGTALASLLLVAPFMPLGTYVRMLMELGRTFDQDAYTVFGLLAQLGAPDAPARGVTFALVALLLAATWRLRSFPLAIAAALVCSPIVWLDYYALLAVPLAVARPRLSPVWLVPLITWGAVGSGFGIGDPVDSARVLVAFGVVTAVCALAERDRPPAWRMEPDARTSPQATSGTAEAA